MTEPEPNPSPTPHHREIFERALEVDPGRRAEFIRKLAGDPHLAEEVILLLEKAGKPTSDLRAAVELPPAPDQERDREHQAASLSPTDMLVRPRPAAELLTLLAGAPRIDDRRYSKEGEVGRGGMGAVHRLQDRYLNRRLAMKVLLGDTEVAPGSGAPASDDRCRRFLLEAQITSQLDHPGVVPVHEVGLDANGKVCFTMRLIQGRNAQEIFADARAGHRDWTRTRALEVVLRVCDTVAFAHQKGVVHRDLKPRNVMVGAFGEVYVVDWGVARVVGNPVSAAAHYAEETWPEWASTAGEPQTLPGSVVGTPSYMAPEQALGGAVDERVDVYAIGAMLYELLGGLAPYDDTAIRGIAVETLQRLIAGPPTPLRSLDNDVPPELIAITERAMARDPATRYASAAALASDLRAYLDTRVVSAYRTGAWVELRLWIRRNRGLAASISVACLLLVLGATVSWLLAEAARSLSREQSRQLRAASRAAFAQADRQLIAPDDQNGVVTDKSEALLHLAQAIAFDPTDSTNWERFGHEALRGLPGTRPPALARIDRVAGARDGLVLPRDRGIAILGTSVTLWELDGSLRHEVSLGSGIPSAISCSRDGRYVATTGRSCKVAVWDTATGQRVCELADVGPLEDGILWVLTAEFDPSGTRLLITNLTTSASIWSIPSGRLERTFRHEEQAIRATWFPDGRRIVVGSNNTAVVWDVASGDRLFSLPHAGFVSRIDVDHRGSRIATEGGFRTVHVWDANTGGLLYDIDARASDAVHFNCDDSRLLAVDQGGSATLCDAMDGRVLERLRHDARMATAEFSGDGLRVLTCGSDGLVAIWDATDGSLIRSIHPGRRRAAGATAWAHFDQRTAGVLVGGGDAIELMDATASPCPMLLGSGSSLDFICPHPTRPRLAVVTAGYVWLWDALSTTRLDCVASDAECVAWSPSADTLLVGTSDGSLMVIPQPGSLVGQRFQHQGKVVWCGFSADGRRALCEAEGGTLYSYDLAANQREHALSPQQSLAPPGHLNGHGCYSVSPGSVRAATCTDQGHLLLVDLSKWEARTLSSIAPPRRQPEMAWSSDSRFLAFEASVGPEIVVMDTVSGSTALRLPGATGPAFSRDGTLLAVILDGQVNLYSTTEWARVDQIGQPYRFSEVRFEPGGRLLLREGNIVTRNDVTWFECEPHDLRAVARVRGAGHPGKVGVMTDGRIVTEINPRFAIQRTDDARRLATRATSGDIEIARILAEHLTRRRISDTGAVFGLDPAQESERRTRLEAVATGSSPLSEIVAFLLGGGPSAPVEVGGRVTRRQLADSLLAGDNSEGILSAARLDPSHPLLLLAMTSSHFDPVNRRPEVSSSVLAEFAQHCALLRDRAIEQLPADPVTCTTAARWLQKLADKPRALRAVEMALEIDPNHGPALSLRQELLR